MSSVRNAVRSPPVEVVIAKTEIAIIATTDDVTAYITPPKPMSTAMTTSIRRRPIESPRQLATALDRLPPAMIALKTSPASNAVKSSTVT